MSFANNAWKRVGTTPISSGKAISLSLVLHPTSERPYVAFVDGGNQNKAFVMTYLNSWNSVGSSLGLSSRGSTISLTELACGFHAPSDPSSEHPLLPICLPAAVHATRSGS